MNRTFLCWQLPWYRRQVINPVALNTWGARFRELFRRPGASSMALGILSRAIRALVSKRAVSKLKNEESKTLSIPAAAKSTGSL